MKIGELFHQAQQYDSLVQGLEAARNSLPAELSQRDVTRIVHDHRDIDSESAFIALAGTSVDSHEYIGDARKSGAALIIGSHASSVGDEPDVVLTNPREAIGPLSSILAGHPSKKLTLVGITGTNGKTTTSYLFSSIVQHAKKNCFTMGTTGILVNGEKETDSQTTPDPLLLHEYFSKYVNEGVTYGAMEVSSHAIDQKRVLGTDFVAVGFTNFSQDHLDYHTTMEEYFEAKAALFSPTYAPIAVVNVDGNKGKVIADRAQANGQKVLRVSCSDSTADLFCDVTSADLSGTKMTLTSTVNGEHTCGCVTPLFGGFNHENIAVAVGLALSAGFTLEQCCAALEHPSIVPGRMERSSKVSDFSVFVDYAHTPDALERVLKVVRPLARKTIVVFGCGGDRDTTKRPIMGAIASANADVVVITSDNPRSENPMSIIREIEDGAGEGACIYEDRRTAIAYALSRAGTGDAVIVAGKGHEHGQIFADHTQEFYDMDVVNEELASLESS